MARKSPRSRDYGYETILHIDVGNTGGFDHFTEINKFHPTVILLKPPS